MVPLAPSIFMPGSAEKKQESKDAQKVLRRLAQQLKTLGFELTKPTFFTRPREWVVEFVHVHKYTFGPSFRVHLCVRVNSDESEGAYLNGPATDGWRQGFGHTFDYTPDPESLDDCAQAMARFTGTQGEQWFQAFADLQALLTAPNAPLNLREREVLRQALQAPVGEGGSALSAATRSAMGLKAP